MGVYLKRSGAARKSVLGRGNIHFHKHRVMQRFGAFRDSSGIWHGKDIGCVAGEARDETRES